MLKSQLKKLARLMAGLPLIGRFVRIVVAVIRLAEFRVACLELNHRQHIFETQQLPTLLETISELNHRQLSSDNDRDNFAKSVPAALRKITRDLVVTRGQLESVASSMEQRIGETRGQLESIASSMEQRIGETRGQLESVASSMEQRIGETRGQLESVSNSTSYLLGRVEFVRRELMFEMRYGASSLSEEAGQLKARTEILSPEKLATARNEVLRLNLGCGNVPLDDCLNVDRRALPGVDIVAEVDELPFEQGEVDAIFSAHLLEHFPQEQLRRELLPYFFKLLKEGGEFHAVVPDAETMIREYSFGRYPYNDMREVIFGAQDYDGDFHFNMFTPSSLEKLLHEAGFIKVILVESARKNGKCFEFEMRGVKP